MQIKIQSCFFEKIYSKKIWLILLTAFLTVFLLMILVRLPAKNESIIVSENKGVYDLTNISNLDITEVRLLAPKTYYPNIYISPDNIDDVFPENTDLFLKKRIDYLSQRFILILPKDEVYTLNFRISGRHAMRVYVNGKLEGETGTLGTTKNSTEVWENNISINAVSKDGRMDIILNCAQFYHAKKGASLAELSIKKSGLIDNPYIFNVMKGMAFIGALLCAASILMGVYIMLSRTKATLYFSLACLAMILREWTQSQAWTYFSISGDFAFMLEYLSVVLLTVFLSLYLGQYIESGILQVIRLIAIVSSIAYGICVLFGDSIFYTSILGEYQVVLVLCIVPGISGLVWNMRMPTKEQAAALYGIMVFFIAAVSDIVMYSDILGDSTNAPVSEIAMLVFVLAQTVSLLLMNNRVLAQAKEEQEKLTSEKNALEVLNKLKTEFLGNVSHELKTPLTVVSGYAQTVKQLAEKSEPLNNIDISRKMTLISSEAKRLSLMVGQILDISRIDEGHMVMEPVNCYIDEIIHSAVETHYPILNKNHNRMDIKIERGLPAIYADPLRISQVIVNLISNAVRFTTEGIITISVKQEDDNIVVCVSDTGVGIEEERLPYIFERYVKKEMSKGGQDTGTGLGLYICKHIVEQHNGSIWIRSGENNGTSVYFTLASQ